MKGRAPSLKKDMTLRYWSTRLCAALLVLVASYLLGCGPMKYIRVQVTDDGTPIEVEKHFVTSFGTSDSEAAWQAAAGGDIDEGIRIMKALIAERPDYDTLYYNITILYEAKGDWDEAEIAILQAIELDKAKIARLIKKREVQRRFTRELEFIRKFRHQ